MQSDRIYIPKADGDEDQELSRSPSNYNSLSIFSFNESDELSKMILSGVTTPSESSDTDILKEVGLFNTAKLDEERNYSIHREQRMRKEKSKSIKYKPGKYKIEMFDMSDNIDSNIAELDDTINKKDDGCCNLMCNLF